MKTFAKSVLLVAQWAALYLAIGTAWIAIKWCWHVYKVKNRYEHIKDDLLASFTRQNNKITKYFTADGVLTETGKDEFLSCCARKIGESSLPISIRDYKSKMYSWWIGWPASMFWTFFSDFLKTIWNFIWNNLATIGQTISNRSIKLP